MWKSVASFKKHAPYGIPKSKGGDNERNVSKMEDCVNKLMAEGHDKSSAIAMCKKSLGFTKKKSSWKSITGHTDPDWDDWDDWDDEDWDDEDWEDGPTSPIIPSPTVVNPSGYNEKDDPLIAFVNASTLLSDKEVELIQKACQKQVDDDYGPFWHIGMRSVFVPKGEAAPLEAWSIFFLDKPTISGALGYHDFINGQPIAYIFISTSNQANISPSSVASHEVLEMLSDPLINTTAQVGNQTFYAYESCDAVQQSSYTVGVELDEVTYPIEVSNFVTPDWFRTETNGPWDFLRKLNGPLELLPNGSYIGMWTPKTGWVQKNAFGQVEPLEEDDKRYVGDGETATTIYHAPQEPQRCLRPFQRRQMDKPLEVTSSWRMIAMPTDNEFLSTIEFKHKISDNDVHHSIQAIHPIHGLIGHLHWATEDSGTIPKNRVGWIVVAPEWRRRGLATALWNEGRKINPDLQHSNTMWEDSREWARTLGPEDAAHVDSLEQNDNKKIIAWKSVRANNKFTKLWLDDVREAPEGWEHVKTAQDAIAALKTGGYTDISLDHDLGPEEAGTGYDVVKWLEEQYRTNSDFVMPQWKVHSANPVGRDKMETVLRRLSSQKVISWKSIESDRKTIDTIPDKADSGELVIPVKFPKVPEFARRIFEHSIAPDFVPSALRSTHELNMDIKTVTTKRWKSKNHNWKRAKRKPTR